MAMVLAQESGVSDEIGGSVDAVTELPWCSVRTLLEARGVRVPALIVHDTEHGVVLHEDLGDETVERWLKRAAPSTVYPACLQLLEQFQAATADPPDGFVGLQRGFDHDLLTHELWHYIEYGVEARYGVTLNHAERGRFSAVFRDLVNALLALPQCQVHRDFPSRTIMHLPRDALALIDFQDVMQGPWIYDVVALLRDSYVELPPDTIDALLEGLSTYAQARGWATHSGDVRRAFALQTIQRKLKDTGRFVFFEEVKGLHGFRDYLNTNLEYVAHALEWLDDDWKPALVALLCQYDPAFAACWAEHINDPGDHV